jgi:putative DNA-invertase from lambdoid prophage Rac
MARTFLYTRVSTIGQTTENQVGEVKAAGFAVQPSRTITETVSGSAPAMQRPAFRRLVDRLEADDVLVVTKLDRLGRNAMDVRSTVDALAAIGVRVHCLALGGVDLTSSAGRMTMQVIAAVAEFERDLLVERTQAGLSRARSTGKTLGRPASLNEEQKRQIVVRLDAGSSVSALAREYQTSRQTIIRARFRLTSTPNDRTL